MISFMWNIVLFPNYIRYWIYIHISYIHVSIYIYHILQSQGPLKRHDRATRCMAEWPLEALRMVLCVHACMLMHRYIDIHIYIYMYIYVCEYAWICIWSWTRTCIHIYIYMYICICISMCIYMYISIYIYIYITYVHMYMCIRMVGCAHLYAHALTCA